MGVGAAEPGRSAGVTTRRASAGERDREAFFALVGRHLGNLYHVVRHELARAQAVGDLGPNELTPEDVVDAVVLRAYERFVAEPPGSRVRSWLIGLAREHLAAEIRRLKADRARTERIDQDIPDTPPPEYVSTLGDETLDFHEPDEDLKVEDVLPDLKVPTPEQEAEGRELQRCVAAALAGMPGEWRRALVLHHGEGLSERRLARAIGRPQPAARRILAHARAYLRQKLHESGCAFDAPPRGE
jgi:RNA polymerase sigma factor (sigma-70 family)